MTTERSHASFGDAIWLIVASAAFIDPLGDGAAVAMKADHSRPYECVVLSVKRSSSQCG